MRKIKINDFIKETVNNLPTLMLDEALQFRYEKESYLSCCQKRHQTENVRATKKQSTTRHTPHKLEAWNRGKNLILRENFCKCYVTMEESR